MSLIASEFHTQAFHEALANYNVVRMRPGTPSAHWANEEQLALAWRLREGHFLESLRAEVAPLMEDIPRDPAHFVTWFESLQQVGPGQGDLLFDWLATDATLPQLRWFLTQEAAGEAGFEDLLACTQVRLPVPAKLECARNFWDEMGHGKAGAMHGPMLEAMVLGLDLEPAIKTTTWESLALSNAMLGMALARRYTFHSIGALGVIELTAPGRMAKISQAMRRLKLDAKTRAYFDLHAVVDVSHSRCWNREIIYSLVLADPDCASAIAAGALIRLFCGQRCFARYRRYFDLDTTALARHQPTTTTAELLC